MFFCPICGARHMEMRVAIWALFLRFSFGARWHCNECGSEWRLLRIGISPDDPRWPERQ